MHLSRPVAVERHLAYFWIVADIRATALWPWFRVEWSVWNDGCRSLISDKLKSQAVSVPTLDPIVWKCAIFHVCLFDWEMSVDIVLL